jgi:hypothetical protein
LHRRNNPPLLPITWMPSFNSHFLFPIMQFLQIFSQTCVLRNNKTPKQNIYHRKCNLSCNFSVVCIPLCDLWLTCRKMGTNKAQWSAVEDEADGCGSFVTCCKDKVHYSDYMRSAIFRDVTPCSRLLPNYTALFIRKQYSASTTTYLRIVLRVPT